MATKANRVARSDPPSWTLIERVTNRLSPKLAKLFVEILGELQARVSLADLTSLIASGASIETIVNAVTAAAGIADLAGRADAVFDELVRSSTAAATGTSSLLTDALSTAVVFDLTDPNTIMAARGQVAALVADLTTKQRLAIQDIVAKAAARGIPPAEQARQIREVVGLTQNLVDAPEALADDMRNGRIASATGRRLSAVDKARIRKAMKAGTVSDAFVKEMTDKYAASLRNFRALGIAGTETRRAAHDGQRHSWKQAIADGELPPEIRRFWIVTPDDRLRPTHAAIPGLNPVGVGMDEPFKTPIGPRLNPPIEPNCRCGVGLLMPRGNIL